VKGKELLPEVALGTSKGLLMNELLQAPDAVMAPLQAIFGAAHELRNTSVYSPDAQFLVWLAETAVHVEAYLTCLAFPGGSPRSLFKKNPRAALSFFSLFSLLASGNEPFFFFKSPELRLCLPPSLLVAMNPEEPPEDVVHVESVRRIRRDLREFLHGPVAAIFDHWLDEAQGQRTDSAPPHAGAQPASGPAGGPASGGDLPTACVVHGYRALLFANSRPDELALPAPGAEGASVFARFVGGVGFVSNWHGFGLGQ
jgi:hypothetical protein